MYLSADVLVQEKAAPDNTEIFPTPNQCKTVVVAYAQPTAVLKAPPGRSPGQSVTVDCCNSKNHNVGEVTYTLTCATVSTVLRSRVLYIYTF